METLAVISVVISLLLGVLSLVTWITYVVWKLIFVGLFGFPLMSTWCAFFTAMVILLIILVTCKIYYRFVK